MSAGAAGVVFLALVVVALVLIGIAAARATRGNQIDPPSDGKTFHDEDHSDWDYR